MWLGLVGSDPEETFTVTTIGVWYSAKADDKIR